MTVGLVRREAGRARAEGGHPALAGALLLDLVTRPRPPALITTELSDSPAFRLAAAGTTTEFS